MIENYGGGKEKMLGGGLFQSLWNDDDGYGSVGEHEMRSDQGSRKTRTDNDLVEWVDCMVNFR